MAQEVEKFLVHVDWPAKNVQAFTTLRGLSNNAAIITPDQKFDAFNLGLHVGDSQTHVLANRQALLSNLPNNASIQWLEQVHGNGVVIVDRVSDQPMTADAAITSKPNVALSVMTADCLPILLAHKDGDEIAAIHGGWRPLANDIIRHTLSKMASNSDDIVAWLGPCIGKTAFEVGEEVMQAFTALDNTFTTAFSARKPNANQSQHKYLADLHSIATLQLKKLGIKNISQLSDCTYSSPGKYYSYRRDGHTGRMASVICRL